MGPFMLSNTYWDCESKKDPGSLEAISKIADHVQGQGASGSAEPFRLAQGQSLPRGAS